MYKLLSGAKSVKQYRGDENLPEAKKGMKNCGCKHSRSKYKYQDGERDLLADKIEGIVPKKNIEEAENLDYSIDYDLPKSVKSRLKEIKASNIIPVKNTIAPRVIRKDTTPVKKDSVSRAQKKTYPTVSGEKKIIIEKAPVSKVKNTSKSIDRATEYFNNYAGGDMISGKKYQIVDGKMVITDNPRQVWNKSGYKWEDLTEGEKNKVINLQKQERRNALQREVDIMNKSMKYRKPTYGDSEGLFARTQKAREIKNIQENVKRITSAVEGKSPYKYGTGALTIPEGSAIVTAQVDKKTGTIPAKKAIELYKYAKQTNSTKAWKGLNNLIEKMPEDNVNKAQAGKKQVRKIAGKKSDDFQEEFVTGDKRYGRELSEKDVKELYALSDADLERSTKFSPFTKAQEKAKRAAAKNKQETFNFTYKGKTYSGPDGKGYSSGYKIAQEPAKTVETNTGTTKNPIPIISSPGEPKKDDNERKGGFLGNVPFNIQPMGEIAARNAILSRGIENVPENYLKLGRYKYESQLPTTLSEISQAEKEAREVSRNVLGGDAGKYLAQTGNLSAARIERAAKEVVNDTLARQDILNKNVDLGNVESQTNRSLRDQYAQQRAKARAAYDEQLIGLGQRVDSATETAQEMANQRAMDEQRLQTLKDLGVNYDFKDIDGLLKLVPKTASKTAAKGLKRAKAYKRK